MTPLQFEAAHAPLWKELQTALDLADKKPAARKKGEPKAPKVSLDGARLSALYRRACEHRHHRDGTDGHRHLVPLHEPRRPVSDRVGSGLHGQRGARR